MLIEDKKEMSNEFNKYFCNVAKPLDSAMPPSLGNPISYVDRNMHRFFFPQLPLTNVD